MKLQTDAAASAPFRSRFDLKTGRAPARPMGGATEPRGPVSESRVRVVTPRSARMTEPMPTRWYSATPPIAILGVPFDNVTTAETIDLIERMVASPRPHYLVTANVDFLVQAQDDVEMRRSLFAAHLVLCDGTPLVWASRLLGNPLPERVAGADLVPLLMRVAEEKGYRIFFLGATEDSAQRAVENLKQ